MLDKANTSRFIIFDLNEDAVYKNLKAVFPKATIILRHTSLPIIPDFKQTALQQCALGISFKLNQSKGALWKA